MADILFKSEDGEQTILKSKSFGKEKLLHGALEDNPSLLSLEEHVDNLEVATIGREVSVSSGSADLLYLDNQGTLNLVEVKLDSNREVRRNVVGQILEYASQMINWNYEKLEDTFLSYNTEYQDLFSYFIEEVDGVDMEEPEFRELVENQLQDGQIRLIVAVNNMVKPLKDIVTFLNNYTTFEIYALQIDQYEEKGMNVYVPRLFGYKSESSKRTSNRKRWDENSFFEDVKDRIPEEKNKIEKLFSLVDPSSSQMESNIRADELSWGTGKHRGSFNPKYYHIGEKSLLSVYSDGEIEVHRKWNEEAVDEVNSFIEDLRKRVGAIDKNINIHESSAYFDISDLTSGLSELKEAVHKTIERCSE